MGLGNEQGTWERTEGFGELKSSPTLEIIH